MSFDTEAVRKAVRECNDTLLFTAQEMDELEYWLQEADDGFVGISPNKIAKVLPRSTEYYRVRVADGRLKGKWYIIGWLIDYHEIIRLKSEEAKKNEF